MAQELAAIRLTTDSLSRRLGQTELKPKADELIGFMRPTNPHDPKDFNRFTPRDAGSVRPVQSGAVVCEAFERQTGISCPVESKVPDIDLMGLGNE
jgi:hypothetical protein